MKIGIVGLPQSGKTTLFYALAKTSKEIKYAGGVTKESHFSIIKVPDSRLDTLQQLTGKEEKIAATVEYLDVAGLEKGSTQRKGFQEQFLGNLRNVDALLCVLRYFQNESVPHPEGSIDPKRDLAILEAEFLLSDLSILEGRIQKLESELKKVKNDEHQRELELLKRCFQSLESEQPLREIEFTKEEEKLLRGFQFLTGKPILLVLNISEDDLGKEAEIGKEFSDLVVDNKRDLVCISAELEMEIAQLSDTDAVTFRKEMGISEAALHKVIRSSYHLLGLISFFTIGQHEVRAWTIKHGTHAQAAAGAVHSDMERGFIRAEVVEFEILSNLGSMAKCKEQGLLRLEGKDYFVQDGDVITFRFNV
ncbi:MAG: redox-regulated ATPase YchF [bacterium]